MRLEIRSIEKNSSKNKTHLADFDVRVLAVLSLSESGLFRPVGPVRLGGAVTLLWGLFALATEAE